MDQPTTQPTPEEQATQLLAEDRFHRTLSITPGAPWKPRCKEPRRVAYSDIGNPEGTPVLLCGGLFGTRYTLAIADKQARDGNVRLITPDKPGIGGSDAVAIEQKVDAWLDTVEALVSELALGHVAVIGHSSGAIYALNTILNLRHLLHPQRPYVALVTPWVLPSHSHAFDATIASLLPNWAIKRYYGVSYLEARTIAPSLGPSTSRPGVEMENTDPHTHAIDEKVQDYALKEDVEGVTQEALFCLKRGPAHLWGRWEDYDDYLPLLEEGEAKQDRDSRLAVDAFFAESDNTSGVRGSKWFDELWKAHVPATVDYHSRKVPETTHETIMRPEYGVLDAIFRKANGRG